MSQKIRTIKLRYLEGQIGEVAYQLTKVHFSAFRDPNHRWRPAINVFQCPSCLRICVELAGVDPKQIELAIAPGRLRISGHRSAPEPCGVDEADISIARKPVHVLAMEIDHGPFEREIEVPPDFCSERLSSEFAGGLLWILLPKKAHA